MTVGSNEGAELSANLPAVLRPAQGVVRRELDSMAHVLANVSTIELYSEFTSLVPS